MRVPTLVLYRQGGLPNQDEEAREVARRIPGASALLLSGSDYCEIFQSREAADEIERFVAGVRPAAIPESFLTTVMFTDLVGSTERAAAVGDRAWRELLASHHSLVRRELAHFRGEERDTAGDGFFATFDGPARAIQCSTAMRDALVDIGLQTRIGVHTGEVERRGDDIGGIGVHIAARVEARAEPGEVLVSRTVTDLVAGSGLRFSDRGEHELKGVPGTWRLYAVES